MSVVEDEPACPKGEKHRWKLVAHIDGCHWYQSTHQCAACAMVALTYLERNPLEDPYSLIWMEPTDPPCERCKALAAGDVQPDSRREFQPS